MNVRRFQKSNLINLCAELKFQHHSGNLKVLKKQDSLHVYLTNNNVFVILLKDDYKPKYITYTDNIIKERWESAMCSLTTKQKNTLREIMETLEKYI